MKTHFKHTAVILKDEVLQIQANLESEPTDKGACHEAYQTYLDRVYQWQSNHLYFPFASKEDEGKTMRYLGFSFYSDYEKGIQLNCIEIIAEEMILTNPPIPVYKAYFKEPIEAVKSQDEFPLLYFGYGNSIHDTIKFISGTEITNKVIETYTKEQMIQCYKDAVNNVIKAFYANEKLITAEQYLETIKTK